MALQGTDLLVVQHAGVVYKIEADQLAAYTLGAITPSDLPIATSTELGAIRVGNNLAIDPNTGELEAVIPAAISFEGSVDPTNPAPAGAPGQAWIVSPGGVFDATWENIAGQTGDVGDVVIYEGHLGSEWDLVKGLFGLGVLSVRGQDPIEVDSSDANNPVVRIKDVAPSTGGTGGSKGAMSAQDKEKLDGISAGADIGSVTEVKSATGALTVADAKHVPELTIRTATTAQDGITQLAVQADVDTAQAGKAVPALLFKGHEDRIDALEAFAGAGSVTEVTGVDPIEVANNTDTPVISVKAATAAQIGVVTLADAAALSAGSPTKVLTGEHYKVLNDRVDQLESADDINVIGDGNAISVTSASNAGVTTFTVQSAVASDTVQGVVQLATTSEVEAGNDATKATTSYGVAQTYLIKDFSDLQPLF